jgi:hypothetical protein
MRSLRVSRLGLLRQFDRDRTIELVLLEALLLQSGREHHERAASGCTLDNDGGYKPAIIGSCAALSRRFSTRPRKHRRCRQPPAQQPGETW